MDSYSIFLSSSSYLITWINSTLSQLQQYTRVYPKVSGPNRYRNIRFTFGITRWEAIKRVMAAKLTRLTLIIAIQPHLVADSCSVCSFRSRRPVGKLLDTLSYIILNFSWKSSNHTTFQREIPSTVYFTQIYCVTAARDPSFNHAVSGSDPSALTE